MMGREGKVSELGEGAPLVVEDLVLRHGEVVALAGVSLRVTAGEVFCLLGPSGSGKSSLLRVIAGVERPTSGRVVLSNIEVAGPRGFVEPEHRRVGMVFQDYALFPHLTVRANVAFGLRKWPRADAEEAVTGMLDRVGLGRHADSYPHMLSGGERQRVALARALAPRPRVLLMDEPFSSLDGRLRDRVRQETIDLVRRSGTTTVVVTHDPHEALRMADRIGLLNLGRLVQCGTPEELYARPATRFAAEFFSDINELGGICRGGRIETPLGTFDAPHLGESAPGCVCIRPRHVRVSAQPTAIRAQVLRTEYLGEEEQLLLSVSGFEKPIVARTNARTGLVPGALTYLEVPAGEVLVVAREPADLSRATQENPT
jgi:iron(III) transport system ATP-binding protein